MYYIIGMLSRLRKKKDIETYLPTADDFKKTDPTIADVRTISPETIETLANMPPDKLKRILVNMDLLKQAEAKQKLRERAMRLKEEELQLKAKEIDARKREMQMNKAMDTINFSLDSLERILVGNSTKQNNKKNAQNTLSDDEIDRILFG